MTDYTVNGISWYEWAEETIRLSEFKAELIRLNTEHFPHRAKRPRYSVLDTKMIQTVLNEDLPFWKESLKNFVE